jgi:hypothetical protein
LTFNGTGSAANSYAIATTTGIFVTTNIGAGATTWTQLGASSSPASPCGLEFATSGSHPTFFIKSGGCNGELPGTLFSYQGTGSGGTWQQVSTPAGGGGFGVYAVDRNDPQRIIASHLGAVAGPKMVFTRNGGTTWSSLSALNAMMTGAGTFKYQNQTGPNVASGALRFVSTATRSQRWSALIRLIPTFSWREWRTPEFLSVQTAARDGNW